MRMVLGEGGKMTEMPQAGLAEATQGPPAHLAGALQAAATARALARRIRNRNMQLLSGSELPSANELQTTLLAPGSGRLGRARRAPPSFARTIQAAKFMAASTSPDGDLPAWHLNLRGDDAERGSAARWRYWVLSRFAANREGRIALPPPTAGTSSSTFSVARAARREMIEAPPRGPGHGVEAADRERSLATERGALGAEAIEALAQAPDQDDAARLPRLTAREGSWDELRHERPDVDDAVRWRDASASATSWRWMLEEADAPSHQRRAGGSATQSLVTVVGPRAELVVQLAGIAAPAGDGKLPAVAPGGDVVRWSIGGLASVKKEPDAPARDRAKAPSRRADARRLRAAKRSLLINCGMLGGFALGIVISGSILHTGFNLGQMLDGLPLQSPASAPTASTSDPSQIVQRTAVPSTGLFSGLPSAQVGAAVVPAIVRSDEAEAAAATGAAASEDSKPRAGTDAQPRLATIRSK